MFFLVYNFAISKYYRYFEFVLIYTDNFILKFQGCPYKINLSYASFYFLKIHSI